MRQYIPLVFLLALLLAFSYEHMTGSIVVETDPCRLVKCGVRLFGFIKVRAEQIDTTFDGKMAVCHCPQDPPALVYYIAFERER